MSIRERIARVLDPASYFAYDYAVADRKALLHEWDGHRARFLAETQQLKFLLSQAPMIDMITKDRFAAVRTPFAYVHPKTLSKASGDAACGLSHGRQYVMFPRSPTKWVVLTSMPEDRVIFTPNPIPGLEKILAS